MARSRGRHSVISLLTDFGTADGYVGAMKGVILSINPEVRILDITHEVRPQDVWGGAFVLHTAHSYFPPGTVHVAVVDPGVGTDRAGIILDTGDALFVAPDNGLLSFILDEARGTDPPHRRLSAGWRAVRIAEPRFWLPEPSSTFHGRDIFAPVAAHLSIGEPMASFGPSVDSLATLPISRPEALAGGSVRGAVLHVDRFGNLITNLRPHDLPREPFVVRLGAGRTARLARTYADTDGLVALMGSSSYLEIALSGGSAQSETQVGVGAEVWVLPLDPARDWKAGTVL